MTGELKPYPAYQPAGMSTLSETPAGWTVSRLKYMCLRSADYGANIPAAQYVDAGVRFLRTTDITAGGDLRTGGVYVDPAMVRDYLLADGDLLLSRSGTIGRAFLYRDALHGECAYAGYLVRFRPGPKLRPEYLFLFFQTARFQDHLRVVAIQSTIDNVSGEKYANAPIMVPPLDDQDAIVRYVQDLNRRVEGLIQNKRALIALLSEQRAALVASAVTRSERGDARLVRSAVGYAGRRPDSWEEVPFVRLAIERADYRGATPEKVDSGVFLVTAKNVRMGHIDYDVSAEYVREDQYADIMRRGLPQIGDVLLTMEAPLGNVALVDREDVALAQRVVRFRLDPDRVLPRFALYSFVSPYFQDQLKVRATGSTAAGIKASKLPQLLMLVPPIEEQREIVAKLDAKTSEIDATIARAQREIKLIQEYRARLAGDVVTGVVDVREIAADLPAGDARTSITVALIDDPDPEVEIAQEFALEREALA